MPRGNINNLIPNSERSPEELKRMTSKGGKISGESRRRKRTLAETLKRVLEAQPTDKEKKALIDLGLDEDEMTNQSLFAYNVFKNGCKGNNKAMEMMAEILDGNEKKELENKRLKAEIEKLKLEQERLKRELGQSEGSYENLNILADLLKKKDKES